MATKPKRPRDPFQLAKMIGDISVGEVPPEPPESPKAKIGRTGGLKGGISRANKLSTERRKEIAIKAAKARWSR